MNERDLMWLVGLLEGEGCFCWRTKTANNGWPVVCVSMTDLDVIERAAVLMGAKVYSHTKASRPGSKAIHRAEIYCSKAATLMEQVLPYMGQRRSARIRELLARTANRPRGPRPRREQCVALH